MDKLASYRTQQPMHKKTARRMAELYDLDSSKNAEIKGSWYKLAINAGAYVHGLLAANFFWACKSFDVSVYVASKW